MSRLGQGSDTTACPWCEGNIDPSGGYFSKLDDNHKSHNSQGFTIFSQFSRSPGRLLNHEWTRMGTKVGSREKKGEGSAWMARLGAPARRFSRASIEKERTTNGHEWIKPRKTRKTQNHEWTRMGTKVGSREKKGEGSAWMARLGAPARRFSRASIEKERTTNGHEWIKPRKTRKTQNHEWTRMGTKVGSREKKGEGSAWMARLGAPARRFRRASIEKERTTNGHEYLWPGGYYPRSHVGCPQLWTGCNAPVSSQFAHLPCGESRDGVGILVVDGVSAARCERSPR